MLWLAFLRLTLSDGNGNTVQSKRLQSAGCIVPLVCSDVYISTLLSVSPLPPVSSLQSVLLSSAVCILPLVHSLQSAFYTDWLIVENLQKTEVDG